MTDLSQSELLRYGRHLVMPEVTAAGQAKLKAARVLCVGAGGLGYGSYANGYKSGGFNGEVQNNASHWQEEGLFGAETVNALGFRRHRPFRVDVDVKALAGGNVVDELDRADLDDAVAVQRFEAGGFGVENDLSHDSEDRGGPALRAQAPPPGCAPLSSVPLNSGPTLRPCRRAC